LTKGGFAYSNITFYEPYVVQQLCAVELRAVSDYAAERGFLRKAGGGYTLP
jgi:hypothetical protein